MPNNVLIVLRIFCLLLKNLLNKEFYTLEELSLILKLILFTYDENKATKIENEEKRERIVTLMIEKPEKFFRFSYNCNYRELITGEKDKNGKAKTKVVAIYPDSFIDYFDDYPLSIDYTNPLVFKNIKKSLRYLYLETNKQDNCKISGLKRKSHLF